MSSPISILNNYPGSKGQAGVAQRQINQIPPHEIKFSLCLGGGFVERTIKPAKLNLYFEMDPEVVSAWKHYPGYGSEFIVQRKDGLVELEDMARKYQEGIHENYNGVFIYIDPPHIIETRISGKKIYRYEWTIEQHRRLIVASRELKGSGAMIMICCYDCKLYSKGLSDKMGWRKIPYQVRIRQDTVIETIYMNYPEPTEELHDYRFVGSNSRDRDRLSQKRKRHIEMYRSMDPLERKHIFEAFQEEGLIQRKVINQ